MSRDANMAAQERLGKGISSGNLEVIGEVFAPTVVDHDPAPDQGPGAAGLTAFFTMMRTAFPDLKIEAEHLVVDDDHIAFAYIITGTHEGPFRGIAPTGKGIKARGLQIGRFENGQIVERWGSSDELGILHQLGAAPERVVMS